MIRFFVEGTPIAQPRPRARNAGAHARVYNPATAREWKKAVRLQAKRFRPAQPILGPLTVHLAFYLPRPKRLMRKKDDAGPIKHPVKPDLDNLAKALLDSLTDDGGWWRDDAQIVGGMWEKFYAPVDAEPGVMIEVIED